jgi:hypothetical protein
MTCVNKPKARLSAKLATGLAAATLLVFAAGTGPARADWRDHDRGDHRYEHHYYNGGYYRSPPVVYGAPAYGYYSPPPVVYGPGVGINLPGINLNIR